MLRAVTLSRRGVVHVQGQPSATAALCGASRGEDERPAFYESMRRVDCRVCRSMVVQYFAGETRVLEGRAA